MISLDWAVWNLHKSFIIITTIIQGKVIPYMLPAPNIITGKIYEEEKKDSLLKLKVREMTSFVISGKHAVL
jgi:hypothetical protein